ncbi:MAG: twin-arginine translocase TatA/TatE family subunit [Planctomycetota bacterium]
MPPTLALIGPFGLPELIVIGVIGLLIFGKRLPEVGKSLGQGIIEFKKGLSGVTDEIKDAAKTPVAPPKLDQPQQTTVDTSTATEQQPASPPPSPSN